MSKLLRMSFVAVVALLPSVSTPLRAQSSPQGATPSSTVANIIREVHHELVMLPRYTIFDNLSYQVNGTTVTLLGQVTNPVLKSDAEAAVKGVEGVGQVEDQIQVLPLSPMDWQIRRAAFAKLFSQNSPLSKYVYGSVSPIHIIVENGHVTLEGNVDTAQDKNEAGILAKQVHNVFSVTNNLQVGAGS